MVLAWLWSVRRFVSATMAPAGLNWKEGKLWRDSLKKKPNKKIQNISLVHNVNRKDICAKELGLWEMEVKNTCLPFFMCQPHNSLTSSNAAFWKEDQIWAKLLNFCELRAQLTPMRGVQMRQAQATVTKACGAQQQLEILPEKYKYLEGQSGLSFTPHHWTVAEAAHSDLILSPVVLARLKLDRHTGWEID